MEADTTGTPDPGELYYTQELSDGYMLVMDDPGGNSATGEDETPDYTYYVWYIGGPSIRYDNIVTGYIGDAQTRFTSARANTIPSHKGVTLHYVLYNIHSPQGLDEALQNGTYTLVQKSENLAGNEIALELVINDESYGFLMYDITEDEWSLKQSNKDPLTGTQGDKDQVSKNIVCTKEILNANRKVEIVLHKSMGVNTERKNMEVTLTLDLYQPTTFDEYTGTSTLIFNTEVNIVRRVPEQDVFYAPGRMYASVGNSTEVQITGKSSYTTVYRTQYVPIAYPETDNNTMFWGLSTESYSYYLDAEKGMGMTMATGETTPLNLSGGLEFVGTEVNRNGDLAGVQQMKVYKDDNGYFYVGPGADGTAAKVYPLELEYTSPDSVIPEGTKITMIDYSNNNGTKPEYYYYNCTQATDYLDLMDFQQMGTEKKIGELVGNNLPDFVAGYKPTQQDVVQRFTEELLFILDFSAVEQTHFDEGEFESRLHLSHGYGKTKDAAVDIMDYVRSPLDEEGTYTREHPRLTEATIGKQEIGLGGFEAEGPGSITDGDTATLIVQFSADPEWENTVLGEGKYSLKLELLGDDGKAMEMPAGMYFQYDSDGRTFGPNVDGKSAIVPIETSGTHSIHIKQLYPTTWGEDETSRQMKFRVTLYSAPDPEYYYHITDLNRSAEVNYTLTKPGTTAIKVTVEGGNHILELDDALNLKVQTNGKSDVTVRLEKKNPETKIYEECQLESVFTGKFTGIEDLPNIQAGAELTWAVKDGSANTIPADPGTYRIYFDYGEHTEFLNIIIRENS